MLEFLHSVLFCVCVCVCLRARSVAQSSPTLCNPMDCSPASFLCLWNVLGKNNEVGCHFLSPGDLPNPGTAPTSPASPASPAWAGGFFTTGPPGKLCIVL